MRRSHRILAVGDVKKGSLKRQNAESSPKAFLQRQSTLKQNSEPLSQNGSLENVVRFKSCSVGAMAVVNPRSVWPLLKDSCSAWLTDDVPSLGAALAFYTI